MEEKPFCPQINSVCKGKDCICYQLKDSVLVESKRGGTQKNLKEYACTLYNRSFGEWSVGVSLNKE